MTDMRQENGARWKRGEEKQRDSRSDTERHASIISSSTCVGGKGINVNDEI